MKPDQIKSGGLEPVYWYYILRESEDHRLWALVDRPRKSGERVTSDMLLGYTERIHNGSWPCYVMFDPLRGRIRYARCVGSEPTSELAKEFIWQYYKGAAYHYGEIQAKYEDQKL